MCKKHPCEEELATLSKYKELIEYIKDNIYIVNEKDKKEKNARKIGVCTDTLDASYYVIEDFIINGLRYVEHKAFITLYALAQAIDINIQATIKLYEIIIGITCSRNKFVSDGLQEFIDEVLNNIKNVEEVDTSILLNSIDNYKYDINITLLKNANFENKEILYRKLIIEYLNNPRELEFVRHVISRILNGGKSI